MKKGVKLQIGTREKHLLDVFSPSRYIEIGTIRIPVFVRLLNYERINLQEIIDYDILSMGLGRSKLSNPLIRFKFPFWFFEQVYQKNRSFQLMITHGILRYYREDNKEQFAPMILIPINLYLENGQIYVQQVARPSENTILTNHLNQLANQDIKKNILPPERLDTLASMDRHLHQVQQYGEYEISLENYMTFAFCKEQEIKIDHQKFPVTKMVDEYLHDRYFDEEHEDLTYMHPLNKAQRQALSNAKSGNNFVIVGRMATGKTITLINIAVNAMLEDKRVLYISNMKETLDFIENYFKEEHLGNLVANCSNSFESLRHHEVDTTKISKPSPEFDFDKLHQNTRFVNDFERAMHSRMLHFRYIEVLSELALLSDVRKKELEIDDLSGIVKHEYHEIVKQLEILKRYMKKIPNRHVSVWREIPMNHQIESKKEILEMVEKLHRFFVQLESRKRVLVQEFGFIEIENFAKIKNIIHDFKRLTVQDLPDSWKDVTQESFQQAQKQYRRLREELYELQELEYTIDKHYQNLDKISIEKEIVGLLGTYFKEDELEKIDRINEERKPIIVAFNRASLHREIYEKCVLKLKKILGWEFEQTNSILNQLIELGNYVSNHVLTSTIYEAGIKKESSETLVSLSKIVQLYLRGKEFRTDFMERYPKAEHKNLQLYISVLEDPLPLSKESKKKIQPLLDLTSKKQQTSILSQVQDDLLQLKESFNQEAQCLVQAEELIGESVFQIEDFYEELQAFVQYIKSIRDAKTKTKILRFLSKEINKTSKSLLNHQSVFVKTMMVFRKSVSELRTMHKWLKTYDFPLKGQEFIDQLDELAETFSYVTNVYASNDRLYLLIRSFNEDYVQTKTYFDIREIQNTIKSMKHKLHQNKTYRILFGKLYQEENTAINSIGRTLQNFTSYKECFASVEEMLASLDSDCHDKITQHLDRSQEISDELSNVLKVYTKHFKDGVTRYYYADFLKTIEFLKSLLKEEHELTVYLSMTEALKALQKHKLNKLVQYLDWQTKDLYFVEDFKFTYLKMLQRMFLNERPYLSNIQSLETILSVIDTLEASARAYSKDKAVYELKRKTSGRVNVSDVNHMDYQGYIRKTEGVKQLVLAPTQLVNHYIDLEEFDLVLIDDAHLLNANEYSAALEGKQVIISGELQLQSSVSSNLISRMRYHSIFSLPFRFDVTPKKLMIHMDGARGLIQQSVLLNRGTEIIEENIVDWIASKYREEPNVIMNVFIGTIEKRRQVHERLVEMFDQMGHTEEDILDIFRTKCNVCDLMERYIIHSDYNVCFVEDYQDIDVEHLTFNMIDNILQCRKKLILYDPQQSISTKNTVWISKLRSIVERDSLYLEKELYNPVLIQLKKALQKHKVEVLNPHDDFSMLLQTENGLVGLLVFWDYMNSRYEMLNDYRDYERYFIQSNFRVKIVWISDLAESIEKVAIQIAKEIQDD